MEPRTNTRHATLLPEHHPEARPSRKNHTPTVTWLSADDYAALLEARGLRVLERDLEVVSMTVDSVAAIGRYWLFIEGALPGSFRNERQDCVLQPIY